MAETPECAYRAARAVPVGARFILTLLYTRATRVALLAYLENLGPAPFVWPGKEWLVTMSGCSRSQVYKHLDELEQLGAIVPASQKIDGKVRKGWVLPLRDGLLPVPADSSEGRQQHDSDADLPDTDAAITEQEVQPAGQIAAQKIRPSGNPAERKSGRADECVRPAGSENPAERTKTSGRPDQNREENRELNREENSSPATAAAPRSDLELELPPARVIARRPQLTAPNGQPVGGASAARALVVELAMLYRPAEGGRCFSPANPRHLQLAEQLLHVAAGPGDDAQILADERLQLVLGYVRDYAQLCQGDRKESAWWGPGMLQTTPRQPGMQPRWDVLMAVVDAWREARRQERAGAAAAQERAAAERREAVELAERRADPEEVARLTAALTRQINTRLGAPTPITSALEFGRNTAPPEDDPKTKYQINLALLAARDAKGDSLTPAEAESIRRRVRGQE